MKNVQFKNVNQVVTTTELTLSSERSWLSSPETVGLFVFTPSYG